MHQLAHLPYKHDRPREEVPEPAVVVHVVVDGRPAAVHDVAGNDGRQGGAEQEGEATEENFVPLQLRR